MKTIFFRIFSVNVLLCVIIYLGCAPNENYEFTNPLDPNSPSFSVKQLHFKPVIPGFKGNHLPTNLLKISNQIQYEISGLDSIDDSTLKQLNFQLTAEPIIYNGNPVPWSNSSINIGVLSAEAKLDSGINFTLNASELLFRGFDNFNKSGPSDPSTIRFTSTLPAGASLMLPLTMEFFYDFWDDNKKTKHVFATGLDTLTIQVLAVEEASRFMSVDSSTSSSNVRKIIVTIFPDSVYDYLEITPENNWDRNSFVVDSASFEIYSTSALGQSGPLPFTRKSTFNYEMDHNIFSSGDEALRIFNGIDTGSIRVAFHLGRNKLNILAKNSKAN